jgi:hypothetical protein
MSDIHKGDIVFYLWHGRPEWAVVSGPSSLNPQVLFGRNNAGKARVIDTATITRIQRGDKPNG